MELFIGAAAGIIVAIAMILLSDVLEYRVGRNDDGYR